jgi:transposase-like protein
MGKERRSFSKEFKLEAVRLVVEGGVRIAQVSRDRWNPPSPSGSLETGI